MRLALLSLVVLAAFPLVAADACVPLCEVTAHQLTGFVPAVTAVTSGSSVAWSELDGFHVAAPKDFCFRADIFRGQTASATFLVQDGVLYAAGDGDPMEPCTTATVLPDGTAILDYSCPVHPNMQAARLVVK